MEVTARLHSIRLADRILTNRLQDQTACLRGPVLMAVFLFWDNGQDVFQRAELRFRAYTTACLWLRFSSRPPFGFGLRGLCEALLPDLAEDPLGVDLVVRSFLEQVRVLGQRRAGKVRRAIEV